MTTQACGSKMSSDIQKMLMESSLSKIRHKILVMSGKGGVGKSSISANLALTLSEKGFKTGLLDVDLHGPSIAGIMGISGLLDVTEDKFILPKRCNDNLSVVSMQSLMPDGDQAIIFRGPAKTGIIRKFIGDVQWGELDVLVIDSPPGTGDEPLSVAQSIPGAKALIITTPQDVALSDVRKSINFCRAVQLDMLGLVENMGPFACPCCGKIIEIFKSGGGAKTAAQMGIEFLGTLPFDPKVVKACDRGQPLSTGAEGFRAAFNILADKLMTHLAIE
ncbi:MAG TPA: ATP-binding protein [Desulfobacteraceae bacterium]|nr:ATP-binding protein [Desulfobacteraceae bacterium]